MSGYLAHITLSTGHSSRSYRDEVSDESVAGAQDLLRRAMAGPVRMLAFAPEVAITVTAEGRSAMIATIWDGLAPVVTFGCARTNRTGAGLWRLLMRTPTPHLMPIVSRPRRGARAS